MRTRSPQCAHRSTHEEKPESVYRRRSYPTRKRRGGNGEEPRCLEWWKHFFRRSTLRNPTRMFRATTFRPNESGLFALLCSLPTVPYRIVLAGMRTNSSRKSNGNTAAPHLSASDSMLRRALRQDHDFEDGAIGEAAAATGLDVICSRNEADFESSAVPVLSPQALIQALQS